MAYKTNQCYKDLEQLLKRPLNSVDYHNVQYWFEHYPSDYIEAVINVITTKSVMSSNYVSTALAYHYDVYKELKRINGDVVKKATPPNKNPFDL